MAKSIGARITSGLKKGYKQIKKRYTAKKGGRKASGGVRVGKLVKDMLWVKSVLNPEKKRIEYSYKGTVGQLDPVATNQRGWLVADITPTPNEGVGYMQRTGASIKLHSSYWHFQFIQMSDCVSTVKGEIYIVKIVGASYASGTLISQFANNMFQTNPFINGAAVADYNSSLNPDYFGTYRIIKRKRFIVKSDNTTSEKQLTDVRIPLKYNRGQGHHIRFDKDTNNLMDGQLMMVIVLDRGNNNTTIGAVGFSGVADAGTNTGLYIAYNRQDYYYDN